MNEIGELLRTTREESGVSLEEASGDLEIKTLILENIEDGNIGWILTYSINSMMVSL